MKLFEWWKVQASSAKSSVPREMAGGGKPTVDTEIAALQEELEAIQSRLASLARLVKQQE